MRNTLLTVLAIVLIVALYGCGKPTLDELRKRHPTNLINKTQAAYPVETPPENVLKIVHYETNLGRFPAYISLPKDKTAKHPAIIWLVGGFSNSISSVAWSDYPKTNDQSASVFWKKGVIVLYPSLRGGNQNAGYIENCYGEVLDVIHAANYLKTLDYVDSDRIYLGGHSTGGTLALLVAESTSIFKAIYGLGPVVEVSGYGQDNLNYDISDSRESNYRAPIRWLDRVSVPTYLFEGTEGNHQDLLQLKDKSKNPKIKVFEIKDHDHFDIIYPISNLIADKILAGDSSIEQKDIDIAFLE